MCENFQYLVKSAFLTVEIIKQGVPVFLRRPLHPPRTNTPVPLLEMGVGVTGQWDSRVAVLV